MPINTIVQLDYLSANASIEIINPGPRNGIALKVSCPDIRFTVFTGKNEAFLDTEVEIIDISVKNMHGVMGQSWRNGRPVLLPIREGNIVVEGEEDDYIVKDGPFGVNFPYNMFRNDIF